LRQKLPDDFIETVYGLGYRLNPNPSQTFESALAPLLSYLTVTAVILGTSGAAVYVLPTVLIDS